MAEVAGLVLGAVGLAGVVGAFKDVVDLYSLFVDSKHLGKDYEILDTKLDIEKTMLLHWANRVRLLQPDYDTRLDDLNTGDTVFRGLKMVLEASLGLGRSAIAGAVEQAIEEETRQQRILSMLWFRTMNAREAGIAPAHAETMDWALQPPRDGDKWDDLSAWLRSGEGIYWVSGKAGSGKSTLMKRLVQRLRTEQLLFEWANGGPYSLVNFFFWYHGTPEQQSQEGLSRSLLHQILSRHPAAIPDVLPGMWKELERNPDGQVSFPSPTETRDAFQTLASKASQFGKFCVFIDGLDEFTGDYRDAIAFIKDLTTNPCFKVVVSSRPIPECNAGFEDCPGLRLQDLTRPDIAKYVDDVVGGHKSMQKLVTRHPVQAQQLKDELVDKSSGVFLWVVLACRSLLSGFAHGDQLADLQHRVAELPPELGDMFSLMVSRVNKRYREQGAFMLRVSYAFSSVSSTAKLRTFITEQPMTLGLALLAQDEQRELCEDFVGWMTSRCGGLLEVQLGEYSGPGQICLCGRTQLHDPWIDSSVRWMHRTVFEFLQDGKVWDYEFLQCHESRPSNSGALSLYGLYLGIHMPPEFGVEIPTPPKVGVGIHMLPKFGVGTSASLHPHWASHMIFSGMLAARADAEDPCALILAAQFGALNYLKACLQPGGLNPAGASTEALSTLLAHAVVRPLLFSSELDLNKMVPPSIPVISWLLASGANPNTPAANGEDVGDIKTHWVSWLKMVDNNNRGLRGKPEMSNAAEVTVMLLAAGADPKLVPISTRPARIAA
ncbi:hypothetical protein C8A05DRAFT_46934 [Staphylotrichum tortipilum]|uniref:NACHT domain-containing protein n=1 Tax=Staphylotrichum tortipilum TaxID=2831512 RepID=A0AAN6ME65_9PEZI|nr:hypothetical protein C8A05DRAFT_46934 [Staphylotrichum longicolle]